MHRAQILLLLAALAGAAPPAEAADVFVGAVTGLAAFADPARVGPLIASGRVCLYQHGTGMAHLMAADHAAWERLFTTWAPTGLKPGGGGCGIGESAPVQSLDPALIGDAFLAWGPNRQLPAFTMVNGAATADGSGTFVSPAGEAVPGRVYQHYVTAADAAFQGRTKALLTARGVTTMLPNWTPNWPEADLDNPFATSGYWANVRAVQALGGGGGFDIPPSYFMSDANPYVGERYRGLIAQQIRWLTQRKLFSLVLLSPCGATDSSGNQCGDAYDAAFLANAIRTVDYLRAHDALPTAWAVLNYTEKPGNRANGADGPDGIIAVACWLLDHVPPVAPGPTAPASPACRTPP